MITIHGQIVPSTCGVYSITNTTNGRVYIGSTTNLSIRWSEHKSALRNNRHTNQQLQEDWNTHGAEAFVFTMEEAVLQADTKQLRRHERNWIERHEGHIYNIRLMTSPGEPDTDPLKPNTRARSEELRRAAHALLIEQAVDVNTQVDIPPLAKLLARRESCHYTTAKLKIAQAIQLARGDISRERGWGGPRPKPIEERKARNGKIRIDISIEAAAQLQRLMLRQVQGVGTPAEMLEYLIRKELGYEQG